MTGSADRLYRSIFLLTAGLLFAAAALRSVVSLSGDPLLTEVLLLLAVWLALLVLEAVVTPRWASFCPLALAVQTVVVVVLMGRVWHGDFYAILFGVVSMRAMQRLGWKTTFLWIALFTPLTVLALSLSYDAGEAVVFALMYAGMDVFLALFTLVTARVAAARAASETLATEVALANREVEVSARRVERLAAAEERHRLARELHDSVTQTVFSMNLAAQSAVLLLPRDRGAVAAQLDVLGQLGRSALDEIRALGSELADEGSGDEDLEAALRRHVAERAWPAGLSVRLDVEVEGGPGAPAGPALSATEEHALFRIAQEALNNVVKHSGARHATVRLRSVSPCSLAVVDDGHGFEPEAVRGRGGLGLAGMRERAREIGWELEVEPAPGGGTCVLAARREDDRGAAPCGAADTAVTDEGERAWPASSASRS
jgi:signal transduction histidine kinase